MNSKTLTTILSTGALAVSLLSGGSAHADPAGTKTRYVVASFPAAGQANAGKYAEAWVDAANNNCAEPAQDTDLCYEARGAVSAKLLNAQLEALSGKAWVRNRTPGTQDFWEMGYFVKLFGTTLVRVPISFTTASAIMNEAKSMPLATNEAPLTVKGQQNIQLDFSVISDWLGIFPNATLTVNYSLHGGVTTELTAFAKSGYGPLAMLRLLPWGSMTANGSVHGDGSWYTFGPARGKVFTSGNVQVIAPNSNIDFNGVFAFATNKATLVEDHYLRLLKGKVLWAAEGWLNPVGQGVDVVTWTGCVFGLLCSGTSSAWLPVANGTVWDQSASYLKYFTDEEEHTVFDGVLSPRPPMP